MPQAISSRRILLVDDSPPDRAVVRRLLAADAARVYEIEEAASAEEALRAIRSRRFDCILLNFRLPDLDEIEFLAELARSDPQAASAVVLLTGRADDELIVEVLKQGVQDCLVKGRFTGEVLRRSVDAAVARVETRHEPGRLDREAGEAVRQRDEALDRLAVVEARLREQLDLIETVARTTAEGLCMVDRRGRFTFVNPAAEAIFGATRADLLATSVRDLLTLGEADARELREWEAVVGSTVAIRDREATWPRAASAGGTIPVAFSSTPIRADRVVVGTVIAIRDVTEARRVAAEMASKAAELVDAGRKKDEFLAMIAHELRNPLAPILNAMRIIGLRGGGDPAQERTRVMVEQQVRQMNRLIDDLLDMSRISRGTIQLRKEPTLLAASVDRAVDSIRHQIEARGQMLELDIPAEPIWLDADPSRLDQILSNLLTNAAKYTDPNGQIRLVASREGSNATIRVVDSGVGIAAEFLPSIFDLFAQADRSLDRSQGGLGIGLTLVRDLVERHGGSISARSEGLGMGSEFVVRLPTIARVVAPEPLAVAEGVAFAPARSVRILVVDDNIHAAQSLEVVLQLWGHDVLVAHDGPMALDSAPLYRPEVVLLDIGLPEMDGYRVAEELRRLPKLADVAILAMTGYAGDEDRRRSERAGFVLHLAKPLDLDALERYLAEFDRPAAPPGLSTEPAPAGDGVG